jgi:hypothetical protein
MLVSRKQEFCQPNNTKANNTNLSTNYTNYLKDKPLVVQGPSSEIDDDAQLES